MYKYLLCIRYLRTRYIALASVISVTLGVATMIVVNAVMSGFTTEMRDRIHGSHSDIIFESRDRNGGMYDPRLHMEEIRRIAGDDVEAMTPLVYVPGMLSFKFRGEYNTQPVQIFGIYPDSMSEATSFASCLLHPKNRDLDGDIFCLREGGFDTNESSEAVDAGLKPRYDLRNAGWERRRRMYAPPIDYSRNQPIPSAIPPTIRDPRSDVMAAPKISPTEPEPNGDAVAETPEQHKTAQRNNTVINPLTRTCPTTNPDSAVQPASFEIVVSDSETTNSRAEPRRIDLGAQPIRPIGESTPYDNHVRPARADLPSEPESHEISNTAIEEANTTATETPTAAETPNLNPYLDAYTSPETTESPVVDIAETVPEEATQETTTEPIPTNEETTETVAPEIFATEIESPEAPSAPPTDFLNLGEITDSAPPSFNPFNARPSVPIFDPQSQQHHGIILGISLAAVRRQDGSEFFLTMPGDDVQLTFPTAGTPPEGMSDSFTIVDFYESKWSEGDSSYAFVPIERLQELRGMIDPTTGATMVSQIRVKLKPGADLNTVRDKLRSEFPEHLYCIYTWMDKQGPLLAAVQWEVAILNVLLFMIIAVAGFGILAIFLMIVVEKTRDIGILKSLGASSRGIMGIFLSYGLMLGVVGAGIGLIIGLLFVDNINGIADVLGKITGQEVFDPNIYYFMEIPAIIETWTVIWIMVGAVGIAVLASILPAIRAALLHPVEALRHE